VRYLGNKAHDSESNISEGENERKNRKRACKVGAVRDVGKLIKIIRVTIYKVVGGVIHTVHSSTKRFYIGNCGDAEAICGRRRYQLLELLEMLCYGFVGSRDFLEFAKNRPRLHFDVCVRKRVNFEQTPKSQFVIAVEYLVHNGGEKECSPSGVDSGEVFQDKPGCENEREINSSMLYLHLAVLSGEKGRNPMCPTTLN